MLWSGSQQRHPTRPRSGLHWALQVRNPTWPSRMAFPRRLGGEHSQSRCCQHCESPAYPDVRLRSEHGASQPQPNPPYKPVTVPPAKQHISHPHHRNSDAGWSWKVVELAFSYQKLRQNYWFLAARQVQYRLTNCFLPLKQFIKTFML